MVLERSSGILLHPTSLPSRYGIGDLGIEAYRFIDFLKKSKQTLWQILPLGPVGYAESPYQCFSAFAGNTMLISIDLLIEKSWLKYQDIMPLPLFSENKVNFNKTREYKEKLYRIAFKRFNEFQHSDDYIAFKRKNAFWLEEFSFFMALKEYFGGVAWNKWEKDIAFRKENALKYYRELLKTEVEYNKFLQFIFFQQWQNIRAYAKKNDVRIIGDLPIFISYDSSDAWTNPELFELDEYGNPSKVAGVPPDYFSETGQLWGNPHYKWDMMEKDDFLWWRNRIELTLQMVDIVRIDHFRGFESYWEVPGNETTAVNGKWVKAPGAKLFATIKRYLGDLPIIAEDLGIITKEVDDLKNQFHFPGMKILQFSFGRGAEERFLPHNYEKNCVVYTGTHDNDTTVGWYHKAKVTEPDAIENLKRYLKIADDLSGEEICWNLIETAYKSNANYAVIPMQDIMCLGSEARMNIPNTVGDNWGWRMPADYTNEALEKRLASLSVEYNRNKSNIF